jgi:hypothetical protein
MTSEFLSSHGDDKYIGSSRNWRKHPQSTLVFPTPLTSRHSLIACLVKVILYWSRRWIRCRRDASIPDAQHRELDRKRGRERERCRTVLQKSVVMLMSAVPCAFCLMRRRGIALCCVRYCYEVHKNNWQYGGYIFSHVSSPNPLKGLRLMFIWITLRLVFARWIPLPDVSLST